MASLRDLGEYIREQRTTAEISLRQLAAVAGVSNPYLSQIERGLRKPSAEILQQIAKGLRVSAEAMYVQAGILDEHEGSPTVISAINADGRLSDRQKQMMLEIYQSFVLSEAAGAASGPGPDSAGTAGPDIDESAASFGADSDAPFAGDEPLWPEDTAAAPTFPPPTKRATVKGKTGTKTAAKAGRKTTPKKSEKVAKSSARATAARTNAARTRSAGANAARAEAATSD